VGLYLCDLASGLVRKLQETEAKVSGPDVQSHRNGPTADSDNTGLLYFGGRPWKCYFHPSFSGLHIANMTSLLMLTFLRFLHCKVPLSPPPLSMLYYLEGSHMHRSHLRNRELYCTSLRTKYLHKLFGVFLNGRFVFPLFMYLVIYLYQYCISFLGLA
jgi:hypothetical protein